MRMFAHRGNWDSLHYLCKYLKQQSQPQNFMPRILCPDLMSVFFSKCASHGGFCSRGASIFVTL